MYRKLFLPLLAIFSLFFILPANAFGISPVKMLVTADSNNSQTVNLSIFNSENKEIQFNLGVLGVQQDNDGHPVFGRGITEAESWVMPENNTVLVKAKQTQKANFIIHVPEKTQPGSYYVGLFAEPTLGSNGRSGVNPRIISLVTVQVAGEVYEDMIISGWNAKNTIFTDKNWDFNLNLKNSGPVEVLLKGFLSVENWKGEEIFTQEAFLGNKLIAGSMRHLTPVISAENKIIWPGLYHAQVRIIYGLTNQKAISTVYIWYLPIWSMVVLGIFIFSIFFTVFTLRKRRK